MRARYRFCLKESGDGATVQPIVQVQFDWPPACSLSVGFPPSASVGCPLSTLDKQNLVIFQAYTNVDNMPVTFQIPLAISQPNGATYSGWCNYATTNAARNTREYSFATGDRPTLTCHARTSTGSRAITPSAPPARVGMSSMTVPRHGS